MKPPALGISVGVAGASSLLGKELLAVLKERNFPVSRLVTAEDDDVEPDVPVLDLREGFEPSIADGNLSEKDFDLVFVAAPPHAVSDKSKSAGETPFLRSPAQLAKATRCAIIELGGGLAGESTGAIRIPFLDQKDSTRKTSLAGRHFVSPHPAAIILSALLVRLSSQLPLASAVAQVFTPASDIGPQAVDELQRQTSSLLSFQKLPEAVFGRQLAFNLLPRFGGSRQKIGALALAETRIHQQVAAYLGESARSKFAIPPPVLRLVQAPVFHSVAVSLYVETTEPASVEEIESALAHERMTVTRLREPAPSQADASGSNDILIDAVHRDASRVNGAWIWAVADNLRLSAVNAVEIAEAERHLGSIGANK